MAHMWFGDLVTMQWWDDLWLNEAFASWAATWASVNATPFTDGWATFLAGAKLSGYQMDMGPATHPIRGDVPDVAQAMANFDAITYVKGESVLKQLVAFVGEDAFVEGLRAYFRDHAWGNTRLDDLMSAVGTAAGRDLSAWTTAWFDRAGTDTLTLAGTDVLAVGPDGEEPRPHRLEIGSYRRSGDGLERVGSTYVETSGPRTPVEGLPEADLHLVNDADLTFAAARTDERSLRTMLDAAGGLPDPVSRALAVSTAWDMLVKGELATDDFLTCVLGVLATERSAGRRRAVPGPGPARRRAVDPPGGGARPAGPARGARGRPGRGPRAPRARAAHPRGVRDHRGALRAARRAAADDLDLAWRVLARRSALGDYDAAAVESLLERDPDPDAVRARARRAGRPAGRRGQGGGLGRALRQEDGARRPADVPAGHVLLAPGAARPAGALGPPLPRRGGRRSPTAACSPSGRSCALPRRRPATRRGSTARSRSPARTARTRPCGATCSRPPTR